MTFASTSTHKKIGTALITSAALALFAASGAHAADDDEIMVFDDIRGNFTDCMLDGGATSETATTVSCTTADGRTTECTKNAGNDPAACSTIVKGRVSRSGFRTAVISPNNIVAPNNRTKTRGFKSVLRLGTAFRIAK